ncbi:MAG TPA: hypothetical protein VMW72_10605 [Sedimentisphaerales bacterium]|nr:hypothetical protein [Sedimentisphaerales bacterium]
MAKKLAISLKPGPAMQVTRVLIGKKRLVYVILADIALKYRWGRSKIAYIGTTKKGVARIAQSVAARADDILSIYGVREFIVRIVTCQRRQGVNTWPKLERALLLAFRQKYGSLPKCNKQGKHIKEQDLFEYFNPVRLFKVLVSLDSSSKPSVKRLSQRRKVRNKTVKQNH